jgi:hypothetical protein
MDTAHSMGRIIASITWQSNQGHARGGKKTRILEVKIVLLQGTFKLNKRIIGKKHMARSTE